MPCAIGVISYLNTRPLVHTLDEQALGLRFVYDVPSRLAEMLDAGEIDVGLIPTFEYLRGLGEKVVPGVSISSRGEVASIKLLSKVPLGRIRTIALDSGSRTSAALVQIFLAERYGAHPRTIRAEPALDRMLAEADAALLIGDAALTCSHPAACMVVDLGAQWWQWQQLPMVFALWVTRGRVAPEVIEGLQRAKDEGLRDLAAVAAAAVATGRTLLTVDMVRRYFAENIDYNLSPEHLRGIERYQELCIRHGLLSRKRRIEFAQI